jgi:hypothetical protein
VDERAFWSTARPPCAASSAERPLRTGGWPGPPRHADQVHDEHEVGVRGEAGRRLVAVGELGGNDELAPAADPHALQALIPARDDHAGPEGKSNVSVPRLHEESNSSPDSWKTPT